MLPHYYNATVGHSWYRLLVVLVVQDRPATEAARSHRESAQKTTFAGANWEIFWLHLGGGQGVNMTI